MADGDDDDLPPGIELGAEHSVPRCWPDTDSTETVGERTGRARWFCLAWANGTCALGVNCAQRHRLPREGDEIKLQHAADGLTHDIFGRPRPEERGRSSLIADPFACQTMLVEGLPECADTGYQMMERRRCLDEFASEWGKAVKTWLPADPHAGYVKFRWRSSAQMCMAAMQGRPLRPDLSTPLRLSWAATDPSIIVAQQSKALAMAAMEEASQRRVFQHDLYSGLERGDAPTKRRRVADDEPDAEAAGLAAWTDGPERYVNPVAAEYPGALAGADGAGASAATSAGAEAAAGTSAAGQAEAEEPLPAGWASGIDPQYGARYFYHEASGRTQWERPEAVARSDEPA